MLQRVAIATCLCLAVAAVSTVAVASAAKPEADTKPQPVTLGGILNSATDNSLAITPDGRTAFFDRSDGKHKTIMVSHRVDGHWSKPSAAAFSGQWHDQDPAVSPDGSYVVFCSNRPVAEGGKSLVVYHKGKPYPGSNLWKVELGGKRRGEAEWLGPAIDDDTFIVAPSIAADGTLYFIEHGHRDHVMHIFRSRQQGGHYRAPVRMDLGSPAMPTHDPAIAPDQSFIVFDYGKAKGGLGRLSIAFREGDHWSKPVDLGDVVNKQPAWSSHIGRGGDMVIFAAGSGFYRLSLKPWLRTEPGRDQ